ncbi:unnamed protein product [marine sediment metagenome]|uniref:Uncharacterized protein n=1 Tax=marine sediment metagenome TaxID=412755 RepID=X0V3K8_9ZZZZ
MKKLGYEMVPSASRDVAEKKKEKAMEWARLKISDEKASPANRKQAAEVLEQLKTTNIDTTTNIPEHVAMMTSEENYQKRVLMKKGKSEALGEKVKEDKERLNVALKKVGIGGGVEELADVVTRMNKKR